MIGPTLPSAAQAARERPRSASHSSARSASSSEAEIGPAPAPADAHSSLSGTRMDAGEAAFRAKEARMHAARQAAHDQANAPPARDEWMLKLPTGPTLQSVIGDPLKLKSRGFSQTAGPAARVKPRSGLASSAATSSAQAWTETPAERLARQAAEVRGEALPLAEPRCDAAAHAQEDREQHRAELLRQEIARHDPLRSQSLMSQHRDKRKSEARAHHHHHRESTRDVPRPRHGPSHPPASDDERSHRSHRSRGDKDSHRPRSHRASRHREERMERDERGERGECGEKREQDRSHRSRSHRSSSSRTHSHSSRSGRHRSREMGRERSSSPRASSGTSARPFVWDREAALGAGGKMLDEAAKAKKIADAAGLSDRFAAASGSSFL